MANTKSTPALRPLNEIAVDIKRSWRTEGAFDKSPRPSYITWSMPYVDALLTMQSTRDNYYADDGRSVVVYALSNLGSWRGENAKRIKAELKAHAAS